MSRRSTPWAVGAAVVMVAFLIWLAAQMSRTDRADEVMWTILAAFAAVAVALTVGARRRRSRRARAGR